MNRDTPVLDQDEARLQQAEAALERGDLQQAIALVGVVAYDLWRRRRASATRIRARQRLDRIRARRDAA